MNARAKMWLKTVAVSLAVGVAILLLIRNQIARSAVTIAFAGGTAHTPRVLARSFDVDQTARDARAASGQAELLVFEPGKPDPIATIAVTGAASPVGSHGELLWLEVAKRPFLVDMKSGHVRLTTRALEERHAPLANGFTVTTPPPHPDFIGALDVTTGSIVVKADNGLEYVVAPDGRLTPWSDDTKASPSSAELICRGGRARVCGSSVCLKFVPDPAGGEKVAIRTGPDDAGDKTSNDAFFAPELVSGPGCVPRLTPGGVFVVAHQSQPGRNRKKDKLSALDVDGKTHWTVTHEALFGERELRSSRAGVGEGVVVVGAVVPHWWHGATVIAAAIDERGSVTRRP